MYVILRSFVINVKPYFILLLRTYTVVLVISSYVVGVRFSRGFFSIDNQLAYSSSLLAHVFVFLIQVCSHQVVISKHTKLTVVLIPKVVIARLCLVARNLVKDALVGKVLLDIECRLHLLKQRDLVFSQFLLLFWTVEVKRIDFQQRFFFLN